MPIKGTEDFQNKRHEKILLSILFLLPPYDVSALVLSCLKLIGPTPWHARGEGWARSPNHCHGEACTRDGNKVSGQHICATAQSCTSTIRAATRTFRIPYIDDLLHLPCAIHQSTDKIQRWDHDSPCSNGLASPGVRVSSCKHSWNLPQAKIWI
jgi:hypothetical protein